MSHALLGRRLVRIGADIQITVGEPRSRIRQMSMARRGYPAECLLVRKLLSADEIQ
jgi:hypothetical protein